MTLSPAVPVETGGLAGFQWLRVVSVPRPPEEPRFDPRPTQLLAAVTASHAGLQHASGADGALAMAWLRLPDDDQMHFLVGGRPDIPFSTQPALGSGHERTLAYPPGSTGVSVPAGEVECLLQRLPHWTRCAGRADALVAEVQDRQEHAGVVPFGSAFDEYAAHLGTAFAWVVVATPVPRQRVDRERLQVAERIPGLRRRENQEDGRLELERAQGRYRELTRARATGMWDVDVLVGGGDPTSLRQAAALLCSAAQAEGLPYTLLPAAAAGPLADILASGVPEDEDGRSPFLASADLVARLARPPAKELPGIRLVSPHDFDVTPNDVGAGIPLGTIVDAGRRSAGILRVPTQTLNRHGFICGATGSGKSQTTRGVLEQLALADEPVPWLVVEPAKAEYALMSGRLGPDRPVLVIRPGEPDAAPACLNPLEPAPGFPLQSHADLVRALFLAAFEAQEPFPQVLSRAITECYRAAGWDLVTGSPRPLHKPKYTLDEPDVEVRPQYPTLGDLQKTAQGVVERIGYGKEVAADVRGFVDVRIGSLREGRPGRFFEGGHPLDVEALLEGNVVLELESLTNDQDKAFLMGAILIRIVEHLRVHQAGGQESGLRHLLVIEEAHRLLKNVEEGPAAAAVELFASLLAEIRAYGEGVLVVEQIPSKILSDVLKNTALKVMHRLPAADDRLAVGATMNLQPEQSESVVAFAPGVAAVTIDNVDRPLLVQMEPGDARESADLCVVYPPLTGRRSRLCGRSCLERACTLREINEAEHVSLAPLVAVWIEAVTAALVAGLAPPSPRQVVTTALPAPGRLRDCVFAHAVDRATRARRGWLWRAVDTDDFAAELLHTLTGLLDGRLRGRPHDRWRTGAYRWSDVRYDLRTALQSVGDGDLPQHPSTQEWARRGLALDAPTLRGQFEQLLGRPEYADGQERAAVGDLTVSGLTDAVRALTGNTGPAAFSTAVRTAAVGPDRDLLIDVCADMIVV
ncbi:ATP-binding protein [Geodermatophilus sp. SYSU D00779]